MAMKIKQSTPTEAPIEDSAAEESVDPVVKARRIIADIAMRNIEKAGLHTPSRPGDEAPRLPDDIDNLEDKELGHFLGIYARWCEYAEYIVAHADIKHAISASSHEFVSAKVRLSTTGSIPVQSAKTHVDPRYQESLREMETEYATFRLTKSLLAGYQKIYEALSREITRRQNRIERTRGD